MNARKALTGICAAAAAAGIYEYYELNNFCCDIYDLYDSRISEPVLITSLADIHFKEFGDRNERLFDAVRQIAPDVIAIPGDIICANKFPVDMTFEELEWIEDTVGRLCDIAPVVFSPGNHERRLRTHRISSYRELISVMRSAGALVLSNRSKIISLRGTDIRFTGLDLPLRYFKKGANNVGMEDGYLDSLLSAPEDLCYEVLLAHNPAYFEQYVKRGSKLVLSGHTHGCLVRIPGVGAVISPELKLFPKYDSGEFKKNGTTMLVSRGLGSHTFNIRVFDLPQVVTARINPASVHTLS